MGTFSRSADLPAQRVSRQDIYDLVENIKPAAGIVDGVSVAVEDGRLKAAPAVMYWRKLTVTHADLNIQAYTVYLPLFTTTGVGMCYGVYAKHTTAFSGTGITAATVSVGLTGSPEYFMTAFDIKQAVAAEANKLNLPASDGLIGRGNTLYACFVTAGAKAYDLTAGAVNIFVLYSELV